MFWFCVCVYARVGRNGTTQLLFEMCAHLLCSNLCCILWLLLLKKLQNELNEGYLSLVSVSACSYSQGVLITSRCSVPLCVFTINCELLPAPLHSLITPAASLQLFHQLKIQVPLVLISASIVNYRVRCWHRKGGFYNYALLLELLRIPSSGQQQTLDIVEQLVWFSSVVLMECLCFIRNPPPTLLQPEKWSREFNHFISQWVLFSIFNLLIQQGLTEYVRNLEVKFLMANKSCV